MVPDESAAAPLENPIALQKSLEVEASALEKGELAERDESQMPHGIKLWAIMAALVSRPLLRGSRGSPAAGR